MFEINLLEQPGLKGGQAAQVAGEPPEEDELINRLAKRQPTPAARARTSRTKAKIKFGWLFLFALLAVIAYWLYTGGYSDLIKRKDVSGARVHQLSPTKKAKVMPIRTSVLIMEAFLSGLPSKATIDFVDVGDGILTYKAWGQELTDHLLQSQSSISGYQFGDLISPGASTGPGYWWGTVAYASTEPIDALRPIESDYQEFFNELKLGVRTSGGAVLETIPGIMAAGEYLLSGTLKDIQAHLAEVAYGEVNAHYYRLSLIRNGDTETAPYMLRVVFNLIEEQEKSPLLSLLGDIAG